MERIVGNCPRKLKVKWVKVMAAQGRSREAYRSGAVRNRDHLTEMFNAAIAP
ncbi:MAG: hypothetical protein Fur0042_16910 [Cyanophyceae cyanobacterium]